MTTEAQIVSAVKKEAKALGLRALRVSMRPGVEVGWPDFLIFGPGKVLGLECKRPGKQPTAIQTERGKTMIEYGQSWAKVDTVDDVRFTLWNFARYCIGEGVYTRTAWDAMQVKMKKC